MSNCIINIQGQEELSQGIHYEVDLSAHPIGEGGMGRVYRGVQVDERKGIRRDVAVKFLHEDLPQSMIERSRREASIRIRHDNLVEMIAFVQADQADASGRIIPRLHVVSELLDGVMLFDMLQGKTENIYDQPVPYAEELLKLYHADSTRFAVTIGKKILSGLMQLHDAGFIHRDIDPSNIMITSDGKVKLIDFGIARQISSLAPEHKLTSVGNFLGKASYAAPELVLGDLEHQNATTDIYAMGILLFQLCTGHLPFDGPVQEVLEMQRFSQLPLEEIKNRKLRKVIGKATQKSQSKRYQSGAQFRVALDEITVKETHTKNSLPYISWGETPVETTLIREDQSQHRLGKYGSNPYLIFGAIAVAGLLIGGLLGYFI